ncbi:hypothetical protein [Trichococcus shcherbakoviae]|uniref:Uncharacterized protein n=1 Tax=Trichococcus shcherbakoviae TaxID=2094020 RepID=A0A383TC03_9LACT|nr:hypothetical protein [Trichococcus shcherbakoviae]SYZ77880.1 Hypothetical protein TART1_0650 [Trichococcus shcherbakoviae]
MQIALFAYMNRLKLVPSWAFARHSRVTSTVRDSLFFVQPTLSFFVGFSTLLTLRSVDGFSLCCLFGVLHTSFSRRLRVSSAGPTIPNNRTPKEKAPAAAGAVFVLLD